MKHLVAGLGETGSALYEILNEKDDTGRHDPKLKLEENEYTQLLHICIPFNDDFRDNVEELITKYKPQIIVIHSTVAPYTTKQVQADHKIPIILSPIRGVHARMVMDLKRYTKFWAIEKDAQNAKWAGEMYVKVLEDCDIMTKQIGDPLTLEFSKILVDTSYYGWLINYAQITKMIADKHKIDFDEMWLFADEIHELLGNRPKMYAGIIGGHCVIPNLILLPDDDLETISTVNDWFKEEQDKKCKK